MIEVVHDWSRTGLKIGRIGDGYDWRLVGLEMGRIEDG